MIRPAKLAARAVEPPRTPAAPARRPGARVAPRLALEGSHPRGAPGSVDPNKLKRVLSRTAQLVARAAVFYE